MSRKETPKRNFQNEELERATVGKYRRINANTGTSMILYRLNAWKKEDNHEGEKRIRDVDNEEGEGKDRDVDNEKGEGRVNDVDNPEDGILDKYEGKMDFEVKRYTSRYIPMCIISSSPSTIPDMFQCNHEKVSNTQHCQITGPEYPDDVIWITDTSSKHGTFVNGKKIPKQERIQLVDGDIIGLGVNSGAPINWGEEKEKRGFVFKVKSLKRCGDQEGDVEEDTSGPRFVALSNVVILSEILKYLAHPELKAARLVSKFWKKEAEIKIFPLSRTWIRDFGPRPGSNQMMRMDRWVAEFSFNASMTEKYNLPNWRIMFKTIKEHEQCYNNLKLLLRGSGHLIRYLQFQGLYIKDGFETDWEDLLEVLGYMPNLQELRIEVDEDRSDGDSSENPAPLLKHTGTVSTSSYVSVKRLSIWSNSRVEYFTNDMISNMIRYAAKLFPNLEGISSGFSTFFGGDVVDCIVNNNLWSNTLKEFSWAMGRGMDGDKEIFNMTRMLSQNLTKLTLQNIDPFEKKSEICSFQNMLKRHSGTLEYLELSFLKIEGEMRMDQDQAVKPILRFPSFPKLRTLALFTHHQENYKFKITFPSGQISYEKDFPELTNLRIAQYQTGKRYEFIDEFKNEKILRYFIPKGSKTVSRTLRWVEFFVEPEKRKNQTGWYKMFAKRFRTMFPYVHHPHIAYVDVSSAVENEGEDDEEKSEAEDEASQKSSDE